MLANTSRRALVLTDESARHPFRNTLPPHVCATLVRGYWLRSLLDTLRREWQSVVTTYCAAFCAVTVFIA
jgi:hypothetical protein